MADEESLDQSDHQHMATTKPDAPKDFSASQKRKNKSNRKSSVPNTSTFNHNSLAIGNLLRIARDSKQSDSITVLTAYNPDVVHQSNIEVVKKFNLPVLENCANFLKFKCKTDDGMNKLFSNKEILADRIVLAIESYLPSLCLTCNSIYKTDFENEITHGIQKCYLCFQLAHHTCCNSLPSGPKGTVWLCSSCITAHEAPDKCLSDVILDNCLTNVNPTMNVIPVITVDKETTTENTPPSTAASTSVETSTEPTQQQPFHETSQDATQLLIEMGNHQGDIHPEVEPTESQTSESHHADVHPEDQPTEFQPIESQTTSNQATYYTELAICQRYRKGICPHGASGKRLVNKLPCKYRHPKRCKLFCWYGPHSPLSCNQGRHCEYLHPIICHDSLTKFECFKLDCRFTHLKTTKRYPPINQAPASHPPITNVDKGYNHHTGTRLQRQLHPIPIHSTTDMRDRCSTNQPPPNQNEENLGPYTRPNPTSGHNHYADPIAPQVPAPTTIQSAPMNDSNFFMNLCQHVKEDMKKEFSQMEIMKKEISEMRHGISLLISQLPMPRPPMEGLIHPQHMIPSHNQAQIYPLQGQHLYQQPQIPPVQLTC